MYMGSAWYPEQWPESRWIEDVKLMQQASLNVARIGEFAWSRIEPEDGRFELAWLERAVRLAADYGVQIVLGTPTAAPPVWLTAAHPEVLSVSQNGRRAHHGARCHFAAANPTYRHYCVRVAAEMARWFGHDPNVIGWQIDNEYWNISYDDGTVETFRKWLKERYATIDALNEAWATAYWSQEYFDWAQLHAPSDSANPGLRLAWQMFHSEVYRQYQEEQIGAIRGHADARQWITHNFHPNDSLDRDVISQRLDKVSWDAYLLGVNRLDPSRNGADVDRIRGIKRAPIWIMETQPGFVNWAPVCNCMSPGAIRAMAWHMVGHGADAVLYWQWRSAHGGQEQYHGSLLRQDGTPRPLYDEIGRTAREFARLSDVLDRSQPRNDVVLLDMWRDRKAIEWQRHHKEFEPGPHLLSFYRPLQREAVMADISGTVGGLDKYRCIIAPHLHLIDETECRYLADLVMKGAHLLLGPRSCFKDHDNKLLPLRQPSFLSELLGATVRDFYALDKTIEVGGAIGHGTASIFAETIDAADHGAEVILSYEAGAGWLAGAPCTVSQRAGKGRITYCGAWLDENLMRKIVAGVLDDAVIGRLVPELPDQVEVTARYDLDVEHLFIINHGDREARVQLHSKMAELISGTDCDSVILGPQCVAVMRGEPLRGRRQ